MALTLDATVGGASSNTYCTLAEAEAYMLTRGYVTEWNAATDASKNGHLAWATRLLDQLEWLGGKNVSTQALRWPRAGVSDRDGYTIENDTIPNWLKDAEAELALQLLKADRQDDPTAQLKRVKADTVEVEWIDGMRVKVWPESVLAIVRPYICTGMRMVPT